MGYWGTGILDNDNAADYLSSYFKSFHDGKEHKEIRAELEKAYLNSFRPDYEHWIYLAYCQWTCGFLEEEVLNNIEEVIKTGIDRQSWIEGDATEKDIKQREKKLAKFFEKIQTVNNKPLKRKKAVLKEYPNEYNVGDCFTFKIGDKYGGILIYQASNSPTTRLGIAAYYRIVIFNRLKETQFVEQDFIDSNFIDIENVSCYFMREFEKDDRFIWVTNQNIIVNGISNIFFTFRRTDNIIKIAKEMDIPPQ